MCNLRTSSWVSLPLLYYKNGMHWAGQHERIVLLSVFTVALLIRVLYMLLFVGLDSPPTFDGITYHQWALEFMQKQTYTLAGQPTAVRPPGYQLALAAVYWVFGYDFAIGRLIQAIVAALTCVVIYYLGKELFDQRVGILAMFGMVFYPLFIYMVGEFYADTLVLLPAYLALLVAARMMKSSRWEWPLLSGLFLGVAMMLRTTSSLLLPLLGLGQFVLFRWRLAFRNAVLVGLGWLLVFSPWILRNFVTLHEFIPIASAGSSLWSGANPLAPLAGGQGVAVRSWAGTDARSAQVRQQLQDMHGGASLQDLFGSEAPEYRGSDYYGWPGLTEAQSSAKFTQLALEWIRQHPGEYLSLIPRKLSLAWSPASYGEAFSRTQDPKLLTLITPPYILFLVVAFYGIFAYRQEWRKLLLLYSPLIAVSVTAALTFGATRHALVMQPALILFAAAGLSSVLTLRCARH